MRSIIQGKISLLGDWKALLCLGQRQSRLWNLWTRSDDKVELDTPSTRRRNVVGIMHSNGYYYNYSGPPPMTMQDQGSMAS